MPYKETWIKYKFIFNFCQVHKILKEAEQNPRIEQLQAADRQ